MFQTFLFMPAFDIVLRTIVSNSDSDLIARYVLGAITLTVFALLMVFIIRIFNICVPSELVPWCQPISQILFLNIIIKIILVASVVSDGASNFALPEVLVLFVLQTFQASYRLMFAPSYLKEIDIFIKTKDFTVALIFFIGIVCKILNDTMNFDAVYFLGFIPVVTIGWI